MGPWTSAAYSLTGTLAVVVAQAIPRSPRRTASGHCRNIVLLDSLMAAFVFVVLLLSLVRDQRAYLATEVVERRQEASRPGGAARHGLRVDQRGPGADGHRGRGPAAQRGGRPVLGRDKLTTEPGALAAPDGGAALVHLRLQPRRLRGRRPHARGAARRGAVRRVRRRRGDRARRHHRAAAHRGAGQLRRRRRARPEEPARRGPGLDRGGRGRHRSRPAAGRRRRSQRGRTRDRPDVAGDRGLADLQRGPRGRRRPGAVELQPASDASRRTTPAPTSSVDTPDTVLVDPTLLQHLLVNLSATP